MVGIIRAAIAHLGFDFLFYPVDIEYVSDEIVFDSREACRAKREDKDQSGFVLLKYLFLACVTFGFKKGFHSLNFITIFSRDKPMV
jgi:hypothetical protein